MGQHMGGGTSSDNYQQALLVPTRDGRYLHFTVANVGFPGELVEPSVADYGTDGEFKQKINQAITTTVTASCVDSEGRVVLVGDSDSGLVIFRLLADGTVDTSFGGGTGNFFTLGGEDFRIVNCVSTDPSDNIYVGGMASRADEERGYVFKCLENGDPGEWSFDPGGGAVAGLFSFDPDGGTQTSISDFYVTVDGVVIFVGQIANQHAVIGVCAADGTLGSDILPDSGWASVVRGEPSEFTHITVLSNIIYIVGRQGTANLFDYDEGTTSVFVMSWEALSTITVNNSWGTSGIETRPFPTGVSYVAGVENRASGPMVFGYQSGIPDNDSANPFLLGFDEVGQDNAFGASGMVSFNATNIDGNYYAYTSAVLEDGGKFVVGGGARATAGAPEVQYLARFDSTGELDTTFATPTGFLLEEGSEYTDSWVGLHPVPSGYYAAAGWTDTEGASPPDVEAWVITYPEDGQILELATNAAPDITWKVEADLGVNSSAYSPDFSQATTVVGPTSLGPELAHFARLATAPSRHYRLMVKSRDTGATAIFRACGKSGEAPEVLGG